MQSLLEIIEITGRRGRQENGLGTSGRRGHTTGRSEIEEVVR